MIKNEKKNPKCIRQVQSCSKNILYAAHNGKIKMSRHVMLRMSLKSLTCSRKIIGTIHPYGHFISYAGVEGLEIDVTYISVQKLSVSPEIIKKPPHQPVLLMII